MNFCKFYGISATKLLIPTIRNKDLEEYVKYLNNKVDSGMLMDFKWELEILKNFLTRTVNISYSDPESRKLEKRVKQNEDAREFGLTLAPSKKLTDEELEQAKAKLKTARKSVSEVININGENFRLSEPQVAIIEYYLGRLEVLDRYLKHIELKSFTDRTVFGKKLHYVLGSNGRGIKNAVADQLQRFNKNSAYVKSLYSRYEADVNLLKSYIVEPKTDREVEALENKSKAESLAKRNIQNLRDKGGTDREKPDFIEPEDWNEFSEIALTNLDVRINPILLHVNYKIYKLAKSFTVEYYNSTFGLDLNLKQYEQEFEGLSKLGLVGLDFYTLDFFRMFISTATFSSEVKVELYEPRDTELIRSIYDIDRLIATNLPLGARLTGEEID
ncbi:hypothetical protein UT300012_23920 [Paraclostridium bifermentans]